MRKIWKQEHSWGEQEVNKKSVDSWGKREVNKKMGRSDPSIDLFSFYIQKNPRMVGIESDLWRLSRPFPC